MNWFKKKSKRQKLYERKIKVEQRLDWFYNQRGHILRAMNIIGEDPDAIKETIKDLEETDKVIAELHKEEREILNEWFELC